MKQAVGQIDGMRMPSGGRYGLTPRQLEAVGLAVSGCMVKEIAWRMEVVEGTVKAYLHRAYKLLRVNGRRELVTWWVQHGGTLTDEQQPVEDKCADCVLPRAHLEFLKIAGCGDETRPT
jgi:DNA-binding CsgD family transcriptional regulator